MPAQVTAQPTHWDRNQYDTAPPLVITVLDQAGIPVDLVAGDMTATVDIAHHSGDHHYSPYRRIVEDYPCVVLEEGQVQYDPLPDHWESPGMYDVKFKIHYPDDGPAFTVPSNYALTLTIYARVGGAP